MSKDVIEKLAAMLGGTVLDYEYCEIQTAKSVSPLTIRQDGEPVAFIRAGRRDDTVAVVEHGSSIFNEGGIALAVPLTEVFFDFPAITERELQFSSEAFRAWDDLRENWACDQTSPDEVWAEYATERERTALKEARKNSIVIKARCTLAREVVIIEEVSETRFVAREYKANW